MAVEEQQPRVLRSVLIAFRDGQAVLPHSVVVEVLPYAPSLKVENAPPWVVGTMLWKTATIPLVSLDRLVNGIDAESVQYHRILLVQALGNNPRLRSFGFLTTAVPQFVDLQRTDLAREEEGENDEGGLPRGVLSKVIVRGSPAVILDMDAIEKDLLSVVRR